MAGMHLASFSLKVASGARPSPFSEVAPWRPMAVAKLRIAGATLDPILEDEDAICCSGPFERCRAAASSAKRPDGAAAPPRQLRSLRSLPFSSHVLLLLALAWLARAYM